MIELNVKFIELHHENVKFVELNVKFVELHHVNVKFKRKSACGLLSRQQFINSHLKWFSSHHVECTIITIL